MKKVKLFENFSEKINEKHHQLVIGDSVVHWNLSHNTRTGQIVAIASTSKDLDKLVDSNYTETEIGKDLEMSINEQLKKHRIPMNVSIDYRYRGAGYGFDLDLTEILKTLNK